MNELDINLYFSLGNGYTAEDEACDIELSNGLYNKLKEIYISTGETYLQNILDEDNLVQAHKQELEKIISELKEELIEVQYANGDDTDPDTGEEYDFSEMMIDMEIVVPEEWEE